MFLLLSLGLLCALLWTIFSSLGFCILQALLSFPWTIVDIGSILLGFYFLFFGSFVLGGSGVLSLGAGFLFMLRNTVVTLGPWNIMLYMVGRWRYIACSC